MERALEQGKAHWGYVKGILTAWLQKGIRTLAAAHDDSHQFRNRKQTYQNPNMHEEVIPDWFREREKEEQENEEKQTSEKTSLSTTEEKATIQETQYLLDTLLYEQSI